VTRQTVVICRRSEPCNISAAAAIHTQWLRIKGRRASR
jgi:hypothetical protein